MIAEAYLSRSRLFRRLKSGPHGQLVELYAARLVKDGLQHPAGAIRHIHTRLGRLWQREIPGAVQLRPVIIRGEHLVCAKAEAAGLARAVAAVGLELGRIVPRRVGGDLHGAIRVHVLRQPDPDRRLRAQVLVVVRIGVQADEVRSGDVPMAILRIDANRVGRGENGAEALGNVGFRIVVARLL